MLTKYLKTTSILKLLSDPTRYRLIELLNTTNEELCVSEVAKRLNISQSTTSHQFAKLEDFGLVTPIRYGQMICYKLSENKEVEKIKQILVMFTI
ncbi:MAG: ArsR/SmtB family transcription factor [Candidatus Dojkabacteria bacterium]